MKHTIVLLIACAATPLTGLAQNPVTPSPLISPTPPVPPTPPPAPSSPKPDDTARSSRHQGRQSAGVFLGVEVSPVPAALSDQLGLADGFGLLVEYVVPGSAAEIAGVKPHDVLKMLNEQILTSADQLAVLVRSFPEGQEVVITALRKGQETKFNAKLQKRSARDAGRHWDERAEDRDGDFRFEWNDFSERDFSERIREAIEKGRIDAEAAREQIERAFKSVRERNAHPNGSRTNSDDAHIVLRDSSGRIEIRAAHGKRTLTVRDAQRKTVFTGLIDTPEQRKSIPADVLPKVEELEREQVINFPNRPSGDSDDDDERSY